MGRVSERLDAMTIRAVSPDGNIQARLQKRNRVEMVFRSDAYAEYDEETLTVQMQLVAERLTAGCREGERTAIRQATGRDVDDKPHWDARQRRYHAERDKLFVEGYSPDGHLRLASVGMREWGVWMTRGAIRELSEEQFVAQTQAALTCLWLNYRAALHELRRRFAEEVAS